ARPLPLPYRLEDIAARQIETLRTERPHGPYLLAGWCGDGLVAYEMARQLQSQGEEVPLLVMFDSVNPLWRKQQNRWAMRADRLKFHFGNFTRMNWPGRKAYCGERLNTLNVKLKRLAWRAAYELGLRDDRRRNHQSRDLNEILNFTASE